MVYFILNFLDRSGGLYSFTDTPEIGRIFYSGPVEVGVNIGTSFDILPHKINRRKDDRPTFLLCNSRVFLKKVQNS